MASPAPDQLAPDQLAPDQLAPVHLAVDLGASSGRVIAGVLEGDRLSLAPIHRFGNDAVRIQRSRQWDVVGLWREIQAGLRLASDRYPNIVSVGNKFVSRCSLVARHSLGTRS